MNTITPFVILSFDRDYLNDVQRAGVREFGQRQLAQQGFYFRECVGVWDGVTEQSYIVPVEDGDEGLLQQLIALAGAYEQDAILYVDANGDSTLHYPKLGNFGKWKEESIGQWKEIAVHELQHHTGYTVIDGRYYCASK